LGTSTATHVQVGVEQVGGGVELGAAGVKRDAARGVGQKLHQPTCAASLQALPVELGLLVDDGRHQCRVEVVVPGVAGAIGA
jgi:hypothetical protein